MQTKFDKKEDEAISERVTDLKFLETTAKTQQLEDHAKMIKDITSK